jgi:uncharacterized protein YndB with AHSA1/START domain
MNIDMWESLGGSVDRSLRDDTRDGEAVRVLVVEREYDAPRADVWHAVTTRERVSRWLSPVSGDLQLGGRFQVEGNAGGEVLACDKPERALVTWEFGGGVSWLELRLSDLGGRTRLQLEHVAPLVDQWFEYGPGAVGVGWDLSLLGLADHLAGGEKSHGSEEELIASPEGRSYVTASSRAWADANIDAGADPTQARAAEERTTAFYTGG